MSNIILSCGVIDDISQIGQRYHDCITLSRRSLILVSGANKITKHNHLRRRCLRKTC